MSFTAPKERNHSVSIPATNTLSQTTSVPDPELRSQINAQLLRDGYIDRIQADLTHTLTTTSFAATLRSHALHLLRTDPTCTTFPMLMARVLADVRADTGAARREEENKKLATEMVEEYIGGLDRNDWRSLRETGSLELPKDVVDEGVRLTREALAEIVEVGPE